MGIHETSIHLSCSDVSKIRTVFFVDSQVAVLAVRSPISSDCSVVNRMKEEISELITKGWEIVLWIPFCCGKPRNDTIDTLAKNASNLLSPEEPYICQQAVASSIWRTQTTSESKAWGTILENKLPSALLRRFFVANFCLITRHDCLQRHPNRNGLKDSRRAQHAATPKKWSFVTSKDVEVWQKPCTTSIAGMVGGNYQYYAGLQERKSEIYFMEAFPLW